MGSLPATLGFVAALAALAAWALWLNLSEGARERIFGPRIAWKGTP